jgi:hypothetical protein
MSDQLSRRSLMLASASGLAAFAAIPAKAAKGSFSLEYWDCHGRYIDLERLRAVPEADEDDPFDPREPVNEALNACHVANETLLQRPVENLLDIVALLRVDHWQSGHFVRPRDYIDCGRERLLRGVEKLTGVAPWEVPDWLVRLVDEADVREAARRAEWAAYCERRRGLPRVDYF